MLQTPKRLRLNNYTSTAPLVQSSAISPIPPLALTFPVTSSSTTANRCAGSCSHATMPFPRRSLTPRRKRRSHIADHVFSVRVDNRRRDGMPRVLQGRPNRSTTKPSSDDSSIHHYIEKGKKKQMSRLLLLSMLGSAAACSLTGEFYAVS